MIPVSPAVGSHGGIPTSSGGFITRSGETLLLDGEEFRFTGLNIYNANSSSANCGPAVDLDVSFDEIGQGKKLMRAWFFQGLATNGGVRDWSRFDATLATAEEHGVKVIPVLANQWADCETGYGFKTKAWYQTDYATVTDPDGTVPYRGWVEEIIDRYKNNPTVAFWQLINEAEIQDVQGGDCSLVSDAAATLKLWAEDVGELIKSIDSNHLVSLGTIGGGQCGTQSGEYQDVHDLAAIDLCEYHDYGAPNDPLPGDEFNGFLVRVAQCDALNKPLFVGEAGIIPNQVGGTLQDRADAFAAKLAAQFGEGISGFLAWAYTGGPSTLDNYDIGAADPTLDVLAAALNEPPDAVDDLATARTAIATSVSVLSNDSDPDLDPLAVSAWDSVSTEGGDVDCTGGTDCIYTSAPGFVGEDTFAYTVSDGDGGTDTATVTVTVTANQSPDAVDDNFPARTDLATSLPVLNNDFDPDFDTLSITAWDNSSTQGGTVDCSSGLECVYASPSVFTGEDSFTYTIDDSFGGTDTATVTVTVTANQAPEAVDDAVTARTDIPSLLGVLGNDFDPDFDTVSITAWDSPTNQGATVDCSGGFLCQYTSAPGYTGEDSFTYTISDGNGGSDTATVTVSVLPNQPPVATDDNYTVDAGSSATLFVLGNDTDPDGDAVTITAWDGSSFNGGVVDCSGGFQCVYTAPTGLSGQDSFTYTISDGFGGSDTATVVLTVAHLFIDNGTIQLGVHPAGHLNVPDGEPSLGGTTAVGLRYLPTGAEATAPGCLCEGWGAADALTGITGWANEAQGGTFNLTVIQHETTASTARSIVEVGETFRVTHEYRPSPVTDNVYEVVVTVENISSAPTDTRYRRVMDWDVEPTAFSEFVTIVDSGADQLLFSSDDGFASSNPLAGPSSILFTGTASDSGPADHGALFDFGMGTLDPGESVTFTTFYGAAGTEIEALSALAAVEAEVYSLGQPSTEDGPSLGTPNTFLFGFKGVGGEAVAPPQGRFRLTFAEYSAGEEDGSLAVTVERTEGSVGSVSVRIRSVDLGAQAPSDYQALDEILTWEEGDTTARTVNVALIDDDLIEGDETFTVELLEPTGGADIGTPGISSATIIDNDFNSPPIAGDDDYTVPADSLDNLLSVLDNDTDPDGDSLTITSNTPTTNGSVDCTELSCTYSPTPGYTGSDSFTYTISDGKGGSATATVTITVEAAANQPPDAVDDEVEVAEGSGSRAIDVLSNDVDPDFDGLTITANTQPETGTVTCDEVSCTFVSEVGFTGQVSFTYTISDGFASDTATVTVSVLPCPDLTPAFTESGLIDGYAWIECSSPDAHANFGSDLTPVIVPEGTLALMTSGLATDAEGSPETFVSTAHANTFQGANDVSVLRLDLTIPDLANCLAFDVAFGSEEYPEFVGSAFNDGFIAELDSSTWMVEGSIITAPDNFAFDELGNVISVNSSFFGAGRVLTEAGMTYDGTTPRLRAQSPVSGGSHSLYLTIFDASDHVYDSAALIEGLVASTVESGGCEPGANEPPTAIDDEATTDEDLPVTIDVTANDSDGDGDPLTVVDVTTPAHGTATLQTDGTILYAPADNYFGSDSFTYTVSDGQGGLATATVIVSIAEVNDLPVATDDALTVPFEVAGQVNVLTNDSDVDGDSLQVAGFSQGGSGSVSCTDAGVCTYTPNPGFSGADSFTYTISDGRGGVAVGTVHVTVEEPDPSGTPPSLDPIADVTMDEGTTATVTIFFSELDGDTVTLAVTGLPAFASFEESSGEISFAPGFDDAGSYPMTVTATDQDGSDQQSFTLTVLDVNRPPEVADIPDVTVDEGQATTVSVVASDPDGDPVTISVDDLPPFATFDSDLLTILIEPDFTDAGSYGPVTVTATDGRGGSASTTFLITVVNVNRPPVLDPIDDLTLTAGTSTSVTVTATDLDGDPLTVVFVGLPSFASFNDGVITLTPGNADVGSYEVMVNVSDGMGGSVSTGFTITIEPAVVELSVADAQAVEGSSATFVISLSAALSSGLTVNYATMNGTAASPADYVGGSGSVLIPAGSLEATISIATVNDRLLEPTETFGLIVTADGVNVIDGVGVGQILPDGDICTIVGTDGPNDLNGTAGPDVICAGAGDDVIDGFGGNDRIFGEGGNDTLRGGSGNDELSGGSGTDRVSYALAPRGVTVRLDLGTASGDGNDTLSGFEDVFGSEFRDIIYGTGGPNEIFGNGGNDSIYGLGGDDHLIGGMGDDRMFGGSGDDEMLGSTGDDLLEGEGGNDGLSGNEGRDRLRGGPGNDGLSGGEQADDLDGDAGNDTLVGGPSPTKATVDSLDGGAGHDTCFDSEGLQDRKVRCEEL
jgi:large repetitive protein